MSPSVLCTWAPLSQPFCPYCLYETQTNALLIVIFITLQVCQWESPPPVVWIPRIPLVTPCGPPGPCYLQPTFFICHCLMQWIFPIAALRGMGWLSGQEGSDGVLLKCFLSITLPAFWAWVFCIGLGLFIFIFLPLEILIHMHFIKKSALSKSWIPPFFPWEFYKVTAFCSLVWE